jgi:hypothetical protein
MPETKTLPSAARAAMEALNGEAESLNIWLRTQANAPAQRPWFHDGGLDAGGQVAQGRVGANQMKAAPYRWRWSEISPYLGRIAVKSLPTATPISLPITTPVRGLDLAYPCSA